MERTIQRLETDNRFCETAQILTRICGEVGNPFAYFVNCVRHGKPTEEPLSGKMNVEVMEILDTARKSVRTGRQEKLR